MFEVTIYTETTLKGPCIKDGQYSAVVEYEKKDGKIVTRSVFGAEKDTTYHRTTLIACVKALEILNAPCKVHIFTSDSLIVGSLERKSIETWERSKWISARGGEVKNKDLWQQLQKHLIKHEVTIERTTKNGYSKWLFAEMGKCK